jgi:hypothetical protein
MKVKIGQKRARHRRDISMNDIEIADKAVTSELNPIEVIEEEHEVT